MKKLLIGILKGAVIGGALGYGAYQLGQATNFMNPWLTYGLIGAIVGLFVGVPIWRLIKSTSATSWVAVLKGAFGFGIGCGLYALVAHVWSPPPVAELELSLDYLAMWPPSLGATIGGVYGGFVELDDAMGDDKPPPRKQIATK